MPGIREWRPQCERWQALGFTARAALAPLLEDFGQTVVDIPIGADLPVFERYGGFMSRVKGRSGTKDQIVFQCFKVLFSSKIAWIMHLGLLYDHIMLVTATISHDNTPKIAKIGHLACITELENDDIFC